MLSNTLVAATLAIRSAWHRVSLFAELLAACVTTWRAWHCLSFMEFGFICRVQCCWERLELSVCCSQYLSLSLLLGWCRQSPFLLAPPLADPTATGDVWSLSLSGHCLRDPSLPASLCVGPIMVRTVVSALEVPRMQRQSLCALSAQCWHRCLCHSPQNSRTYVPLFAGPLTVCDTRAETGTMVTTTALKAQL